MRRRRSVSARRRGFWGFRAWFSLLIQGFAQSVNRSGQNERDAPQSRNIAKSSKSLDGGDVGKGTRVTRGGVGTQSMGRLDRYIVVTAGGAFVAALLTLTGMVWLTQILRRFDLVTSQG